MVYAVVFNWNNGKAAPRNGRRAQGDNADAGLRQDRHVLWVHQDSNLEPIGYEPTALTIELWTHSASTQHKRLVKPSG